MIEVLEAHVAEELTSDVAVATGSSKFGGTSTLIWDSGAGRSIPEPVLVAIALDKMCHEMLVINGSGLKWAWPGEEEMAAKRAGGKKIIDRPSVWAYYRRKLARAETQGNPLLATEPVPFAPI